MSQENVEIVRELTEALNAKDIQAALAACHPSVEFVVRRSAIEGPYRGERGARRMAAGMFEWNLTVQIENMRDYGDRVIVLGRQRGSVRELRRSTTFSLRSTNSTPGR